MKYIFLVLFLVVETFASVLTSPIVSVDAKKSEVTINIEKIDVGISGFVVHKIAEGKTTILQNATVMSFDDKTKVATLKITDFTALKNSALPSGRWSVEVGDNVVLAFGYTRGILIAPNEEIYYRITKQTKLQWIHPDIFATILSFNGHPTPLREDFLKMSIGTSVGLVFIFLDKIVYTVDAKSFKILAMSPADLHQDSKQMPFFTRVEKIDAAWWGKGSNELEDYTPHYYKLLLEANPNNKKLKVQIEKVGVKL